PTEVNPYFNRGLAQALLEKYDAAIADFTRVIQLDAKYSNAYYRRAQAYIKKGDYDQAISDYNKLLEMGPNDLYPYKSRAWAELYMNNGALANKDASQYLELNGLKGDSAPYAVIIGYIGLRKSGKILAAKTFLDTWIKQVDEKAWTTQILNF